MLALLGRVMKWLHGINGSQFEYIKAVVTSVDWRTIPGTEKLVEAKKIVADYMQSDAGKALLGKLSNSAINWAIETAVGLLRK